jgi:predicted protein tyrosine phosphatase
LDRIRPWLFIGKYRDTLNGHLLSIYQIKAMLQLAEVVKQPGITSLYLSVEDFEPIPPEILRQGVDFVRKEKQRGHPILVACGAGINRSTAYCVAVLKEEEGLGLLDAFKEVKRNHSIAMPHPPIWQSLCEYYKEDIPIDILLTFLKK